MAERAFATIEVAGREVRLSNPDTVFFPQIGVTTRDLCDYYLTVADAALAHLRDRPTVLKRWVDGIAGEPFFQKRVPESAPDWIETATVTFPSGRSARELAPADAAHLVWAVNLGVIDFNPWPVRRPDLDHPDELRVDLDPGPGVPFADVRTVALTVGDVLREEGLVGWPKTSGSRGIHVLVRIPRGGASAMCAGPRWRSLARWSAACRRSAPPGGGRRSATASSSITTRTRATARSPRPTR